MQNRFLRPDALIEVEAIFLKTAGIERAAHCEFDWPVRLAEIVDANPKKVAAHVIVGLDELLLLLHLDEIICWPFENVVYRLLSEVDAARAAQRRAFGANEAALRIGFPVDAVILLAAVAPPVDIVVSDDTELLQKGRRSSLGLRGDLITADSNGTRQIFAVDDVDEPL
jgi:hypothetical protein